MMAIIKTDLQNEARKHGYRPEILEKVYRLLNLLDEFNHIPYLNERLALKGGTAINLFCTNHLPRLSVDLDFNYIGSADKETMLSEKSQLETLIQDTCKRLRYELHRNPRAHAGGKMVLVYQSILGNKGRLEIDLNYLFRVPLWDVTVQQSPQWPMAVSARIVDIHELAAGKLQALLGRVASRDLFDSHLLLTNWHLDPPKLRQAFTVYAGMQRADWKNLSPENINFTVKDIRDKLIPVLKISEIPTFASRSIKAWADALVNECKSGLSSVLPFSLNEQEFLDRLQKYGEIKPDLISNDSSFCERVMQHPALRWRTQKTSQ